ncbi:MAG TPA: 23S rRNA (pseudouridine(1915)-N(3))-methyltransferase RlmH [Clostridia bacterium]
MINIICVGKAKEKYFIEACDEYLKRLSKYTKINIIEKAEYKLSDNNAPAEIEKALNYEGELIVPNLKGTVVCLDSHGEQLTSEEFAKYLNTHISPDITFVIGSSFGLSSKIKKSSNMLLSFGKMTYPHRLMRVILLEQIYRAFCINNNSPYHK